MLRKPTKTFKMSKETKRLLATMGPHALGELRLDFIDSQLTGEVVVKSRAERDTAEKTAK